MDKDRLKAIQEAIAIIKSIRLNALREYLGISYSYSELKMGIAAHLSVGEGDVGEP
ncbi:hypothetical protein D9M68_733390 [compost metagenome]